MTVSRRRAPKLSRASGLVLCRPDKASATILSFAPASISRRDYSLSPTLARDAAAGFSHHSGLERKLARELGGEVRFDAFTRGRYAADASIYQIMPAGVVFPKDVADLEAVLRIAREESVSVVARGAGTSQNGQPIGAGLVVDFSRSLNAAKSYDPKEGVVTVEPGGVLERLNARLKRDGPFFPVEPSTASRCT